MSSYVRGDGLCVIVGLFEGLKAYAIEVLCVIESLCVVEGLCAFAGLCAIEVLCIVEGLCASESLYGDTRWVVVILQMWVEIWSWNSGAELLIEQWSEVGLSIVVGE